MRKAIIFFFLGTLLLCSLTAGAEEDASWKPDQPKTFLMIHFETGARKTPWNKHIAAGSDTKNLKYQAALWPEIVKMVEAADSYGFKLTLALTPQWAEYILEDPQKVETVKKWQAEGHEIAFHHHGYDHLDWDGYSNRRTSDVINSELYRGTAAEGFEYVQRLAAPQDIMTGCVTDIRVDKPPVIKIITFGGVRGGHLTHTISTCETMKRRGASDLIWVGHGFLESYYKDTAKSNELLGQLEEEYNKAKPGEIVGVVLHVHDFKRYPQPFLEWLTFVASKHNDIRTLKETVGSMDSYCNGHISF